MRVVVQLRDGRSFSVEADEVGFMPGGFLGCVKASPSLLTPEPKGKVVAAFNTNDVVFYWIDGEAAFEQK